MSDEAETKEVLTPGEAIAYLRGEHGIQYHPNSLGRLVSAGRAPGHMVGGRRMYRRSLLDEWVLGNWTPDAV